MTVQVLRTAPSRKYLICFIPRTTPAEMAGRGLGLGLSLCRSIITAHGGEISVQDHQPHGSVFRFTLRASEVKMYE